MVGTPPVRDMWCKNFNCWDRNPCLFAFSYSLWKVFPFATVREEGTGYHMVIECGSGAQSQLANVQQVEFCVNGVKQNHAMKLGEGGEAFFVFETTDDIPESLQTSPVISPVASPEYSPGRSESISGLQEPEYLDLSASKADAISPDSETADLTARMAQTNLGIPWLSN